MAQSSQLDELARRRRLLVEQSTELRRQLLQDLAGIRASVGWVQTGLSVVRSSRLLWPAIAGVTGLFVARRGGGWLRKGARLLSCWRMAKQMSGLWRALRRD